MEKFKNIVVFGIIPVLIALLLYVNADLQSKKYNDEIIDLKQYNADITAQVETMEAKTGTIIEIPLVIKNLGTMAWIKNEDNSINLSYHILNEDSKIIIDDGERTTLKEPVKSGETTELNAIVQVPDVAGIYYIEFDMVHEGVTWFKDKGSKTRKMKLEVE